MELGADQMDLLYTDTFCKPSVSIDLQNRHMQQILSLWKLRLEIDSVSHTVLFNLISWQE